MAQTLRIAVVGAGSIGPRHAQSVVSRPDTVLVSFVDPSPQARDVAASFNVPLYRDVQNLLASGDRPEAAIVCTPNHLHVPVAEELLGAGIHVLVEKPVAVDTESGQRLLRAATSSGKSVLVGHHRRFNPYVTAAKYALETGAIGKPIAVSGLWVTCKPDDYFLAPTEWRASAQSGGPILINLIHEIDTLQYLLGPITRVHAEQTLSQRTNEAEEGVAILLRFKSGVVGTLVMSDATPSNHYFESGTGENPVMPRSGKDFYRIFGSDGTLSVGDMTVSRHRQGDDRSWSHALIEEPLKVGHEVPFDEQIKHFAQVIRGGASPRCTLQDGLSAMHVVEAVKLAMQSGTAVDVDNGL